MNKPRINFYALISEVKLLAGLDAQTFVAEYGTRFSPTVDDWDSQAFDESARKLTGYHDLDDQTISDLWHIYAQTLESMVQTLIYATNY